MSKQTMTPGGEARMTPEQEARWEIWGVAASSIDEARSALDKFGWQADLSDAEHLAILLEEVGEVARELNEAVLGHRPVDRQKLREELVQVAAMAAKMFAVGIVREGAK